MLQLWTDCLIFFSSKLNSFLNFNSTINFCYRKTSADKAFLLMATKNGSKKIEKFVISTINSAHRHTIARWFAWITIRSLEIVDITAILQRHKTLAFIKFKTVDTASHMKWCAATENPISSLSHPIIFELCSIHIPEQCRVCANVSITVTRTVDTVERNDVNKINLNDAHKVDGSFRLDVRQHKWTSSVTALHF